MLGAKRKFRRHAIMYARLTDKHLAAKVYCVDDEIIEWLKRREQHGRTSHAANEITPSGRRLECSCQSAYNYLP